jgi:hypothetical protein
VGQINLVNQCMMLSASWRLSYARVVMPNGRPSYRLRERPVGGTGPVMIVVRLVEQHARTFSRVRRIRDVSAKVWIGAISAAAGNRKNERGQPQEGEATSMAGGDAAFALPSVAAVTLRSSRRNPCA